MSYRMIEEYNTDKNYNYPYATFEFTETLDPEEEHKLYMEIAQWCIDNLPLGKYAIDDPLNPVFSGGVPFIIKVYIYEKELAMAFKIRWS